MLEVKPKYVTVNGATGGTFYGTSGTRYVIPPNCLQDGAGNPVTTNVQFEVAEYLKKGDMIFSKMLPFSDGKPLFSGGEVAMKATLGGQPVYLKPGGCIISAIIPKDKDTVTGMVFFSGQEIPNPTDHKVNWNIPKDSTPSSRAIVYNGDSITIISDSIKYANADRIMNEASYTYQDFHVVLSAPGSVNIISAPKLNAFALYDNYKFFFPLRYYADGVFNEDHVPNVPVHFVTFGVINNRFYAGVTAATPKTGENYTVTLTETDPAAFKAQLNNLTK
jgi:hypothetical protein